MLTTRPCAACSRPFHGRIDRKTCSDACRQRVRRAQAVTVAVTTVPTAVTPSTTPVTTAWRGEAAMADPFEHWHRFGGADDAD